MQKSFCFTDCISPIAISSFLFQGTFFFLSNSLLGQEGLNYRDGVQEIRHVTSAKK